MAVATVYRPFTIARILGLNYRTVQKLMDDGLLPSGHLVDRGVSIRCVAKSDLVMFMKNNGWWDSMPAVSRYLLGLEE
jgi:hypothetical protein